MKLPGGFDLGKMQRMVSEAQRQQDEMEKKLGEVRVEAAAGGGIVSVQMSGKKELLVIKIDPDALKDGDVEMLQDLIIAAVNEANRKADEKGQDLLRSQVGGLEGLMSGLGLKF
jgi:nucleoid-associated protein EbfC